MYEARAAGADALLLIAAILPDTLLADLLALTAALGMEALVEVHDEEEVERVLKAEAPVIGINNRDLRTFRTDLATTLRLRPLIPSARTVVSESGIATVDDAHRLRAAGVHAALVGESLMLASDVRSAMRGLMVEKRA